MINPRFHISVSDSHFCYKFHAGCQRASRGDEGVICKKCSLKREEKKNRKTNGIGGENFKSKSPYFFAHDHPPAARRALGLGMNSFTDG